MIAAADVLLWHGKPDGARGCTPGREARRLHPAQVRAARIGAYPNALREYIDAGNYGAALDLVDQWDETFPTDKPNGQTFFCAASCCALRGQPKEAVRHLARAIGCPRRRLRIGSPLAPRPIAGATGKPEEARRELARLVASGLNDPFTKLAREKLGQGAKKN